MESSYDLARIDALVGRIFSIEDITIGDPQKDFVVRYRGKLRGEDSEAAYDQLAQQLESAGITPLFRWDGDRHAIFLVPGKPKPNPSNPWVNLAMFILTLFSVALVGGLGEIQNRISRLKRWAPILSRLFGGDLVGGAVRGQSVGHTWGARVRALPHGTQARSSCHPAIFHPFPLPPFGTMARLST